MGSERVPDAQADSVEDTATLSMSRIRIALLEEMALSTEDRGHNPYDTHPSGIRDIWGRTVRRS